AGPPAVVARRRLVAMMVALLTAFSAIAVWLGAVQGPGRYAERGQRAQRVALPASRGAIFDRNGRELAISAPRPTVVVHPRLVTDPRREAAALAPVLGVDEALLRDRMTRGAGLVFLARMVDEGVAAAVRALNLDGVSFIDEPQRFTPGGDLAAPVLGKVGIDNTGLSGLERQLEGLLAGRPGELLVERDAGGRRIPGGVLANRPASPGDDVVLTLDRSLQHEAERALAEAIAGANAKGGVVSVMETRTGEILALANLVAGTDGQRPKPAPAATALTDAVEPGSLNKLITIAGALEEGLIVPTDRLAVPSTIRVADHTFSEHDPHPTLDWSITEIMANSSNVGSIMIGQRLGRDRLDRYLREFGFGTPTSLSFPGESAGVMLDPRRWSGTSIATISIGQGVAVTAMQMLAAYNTVANGGEYVAPKLVRAVVGADGQTRTTPPSERRRVISAETAADVATMLDEVVRTGTGANAAIDGYSVAGKTGTARKPLEGARGYKAGAYLSSFAGFVPSERPALTVLVMLDEPTPIYGG
ncbi:MAG: peptidoglycan D,D-transpeptidase FtsI family protein, partial [Acidimicrobiales bacterium]